MSSDEVVATTITVNGQRHVLHIAARRTLAEVLREDLDLTGTHLGCEQGVCGACTVVVNDVAVRSCLLLVAQADGSRIETVEGLSSEPSADGSAMHKLQEEFWNNQALQCGFCTPGFIMTALVATRETPQLSREEWKARLAGNLCRCTGYQSIVDAVCAFAGSEEAECDDHQVC